MDTPRLSVIVTTHHRPKLLRRAIESVKSLGEDVQIVLCADEGSTETRRIAVEHLRSTDIFMSLPGCRGPAGTRNAGLQFASGRHVSFMDDDDTLDPIIRTDLLDKLQDDAVLFTDYRKIFEETGPDGTISAVRVNEKSTARKPLAELDIRNFIPVHAFFAPRQIISDLRFDCDLTMSEDWEFLLQLKRRAEFRHIPIIAANWHMDATGPASRNAGKRRLRAENYLRIYERHPVTSDEVLRGREGRLRELGVDLDRPEARRALQRSG